MGVKYLDTDCCDYDADDDKYDKKVVVTTGCGCCSKRIVVKAENFDEICYHLRNTHQTVQDVYSALQDLGLTWVGVEERAKIFEQSRKEKR